VPFVIDAVCAQHWWGCTWDIQLVCSVVCVKAGSHSRLQDYKTITRRLQAVIQDYKKITRRLQVVIHVYDVGCGRGHEITCFVVSLLCMYGQASTWLMLHERMSHALSTAVPSSDLLTCL
jgi:hypothetical protein